MYSIILITRTVLDKPGTAVFKWFALNEQEAYAFINEYQKDDMTDCSIEYKVETIYSYKV